MKKFILYIILVLGITQLNLSCAPETNPPFLAKLGIKADSLMDKPFPKYIDYDNVGMALSIPECYKLIADSARKAEIVSWKKIKDNYLVFLGIYAHMDCYLFDAKGNILDKCEIAHNMRHQVRVLLVSHSDGICCEISENEPKDEVKWKVRYIGENRFETTEIINDTNFVTRLYDVADRISLISRVSPQGIQTPSADITTLPISEAYKACELLSKTRNLHFVYEDVYFYSGFYYRDFRLYPYLMDNPQAVFQWIYEHKEDKTIQDVILKNYIRAKEINNKKLSLDFLRENILKLKDKKAQEYLLNMKVFKNESSVE